MRTLSTVKLASRILFLLVPASLFGQNIPNWTVPPYRSAGASGGLTTMTDISPGVGFVAMQPCRVVDTRPGSLFPAGYGGPIMAANSQRDFDINSAAHCPGIPTAAAYSLNFTVTQTAGAPGDIRVWPKDNPPPPAQLTSVLNWVSPNMTIANATIVPAGTGGSITVYVAGTATHLLIDINGYFTALYNSGNEFVAVAAVDAGAALLGQNNSSAAGSHGVGGFAGGAGVVHGVQGQVGPSALIGSSGVHGISDSTFKTYGVLGETESAVEGAAGVLGRDGSGTMLGLNLCCASAGIRGESKGGHGILGISELSGVEAVLKNAAGDNLAAANLAVTLGGVNYGLYSNGNVHVNGALTVAGMKPFVQPHPYDASKEIRYVALEGPHSEIYFRGTAQIPEGVTRIPIPEDFRLVATRGSYSTLVSPVGAMATVAILSEDEDGLVVETSRSVKIHYVVYAEREAVRNPAPIIENIHFRPDPNGDLLAHLPASYRQLMVQNGTLNPDGTVNMETATRLGWDRDWNDESRIVRAQGHP